jgi:hypothetical protein
VNVTDSELRYQPFAFGAREGVAEACGGVASYLRGNDTLPAFPALSRQDPATEVDALSGPW